MYKTIWLINTEEFRVEFTYYHFGKEPKFPSWYLQKGIVYKIEMEWNVKLVNTPKMFFKCLFHKTLISSVHHLLRKEK